MSSRDWSTFAPLFSPIPTDDPRYVVGIDQLGKYARDVLAALGVNVDDEDVLFVIYATLAFASTVTSNAERAETMCAHGADDARGIHKAIGTALGHLVPEAARRGF